MVTVLPRSGDFPPKRKATCNKMAFEPFIHLFEPFTIEAESEIEREREEGMEGGREREREVKHTAAGSPHLSRPLLGTGGPALHRCGSTRPFQTSPCHTSQRESFFDNLLVRNHFIIVMIRWTSLAPWEFESPFPGSLTSTFLVPYQPLPNQPLPKRMFPRTWTFYTGLGR